ncbi:hypothetical protein [Mesorhizobium sp. B2-7-1]|uniref:hypothetical protein n=1 Tax=Mesorhizobium sp. B2-7-1 TaxID=2589909 RepID=UPI00112AD09C|nr:hypothetical protein [Mesorhizobium sp. B2-7-1]TPJ73053.1 hypothetical protein FJ471_05310 [Mesorhizobium sp. B2-7-1]
MPDPLVFPTWRDSWLPIEGMPELLAAADAALRQRRAGNHRIPLWSATSPDKENLAVAIRALHAWAEGEAPPDVAARPRLIRRIHDMVSPVLHAAAWPRWLLLEHAFLDASATGDLLFAALVLRTLCEEAIRLHALDIDANRLTVLAGSTVKEDEDRVKQFVSFAWASLAGLSMNTIIEGVGWPSLSSTAKAMPRLERARAALNSYVHPNYGSHIVALYPERSAAARLVLEAVATVYEAFFALSWSQKKLVARTLPHGLSPSESWKRTTRRFMSDILPELRRTAENDMVAEVIKAPATVEWLATERNDLEAILRDPAAVPLIEGLPRKPLGPPDAHKLAFRTWEGARAADILGFAAARRAEQNVVSEFPAGAPAPTDQVRWLRFNALCLQLAMLIDRAKAAALKVQLVRQIVQGNSLAIPLCVRSLIEHRALAVWLPAKIGSALDTAATEIQADRLLPEFGRQAETALANFLASQGKETREERRAWIMSEQGGVRVAWLNLKNIVEAAFGENDRFHKLYALSSAAMHARSCRGMDFLLRAADLRAHSRYTGLLVLERLCTWNE